jgi:SanA protein
MGKRRRSRRVLLWSLVAVGILGVLAGLAVLATNLIIIRGADDYIVQDPEDAPHAQCAIVLGARIYEDGTPYPMLADRLETGIELYELGKVDKLLLSGDYGQKDYDEVDAMLEYVLARGVPDEDVFTDYAGFDTYDTMYRARDVFQVETALIVTQSFHLSRAVYTARTLGLEATGVVADLQPYSDEGRNAAREVLARVNAILQLHLTHPGPSYLGPVIPITGDGRQTRGAGFALYLLDPEIQPSELATAAHVDIADIPLVSTADIFSYTKATHEIELTPAAYDRIVSLVVPVSGRSFVVCVDQEPVYTGAFWTDLSSASFDGVVIRQPLGSDIASDRRVITLDLGYPGSTYFSGEDPRADPTVLQALEQAGKLR